MTGCAPAGYDVSTQESYEATMASFDEIVGLKYLKGMHINDSKCGRPPACPRSGQRLCVCGGGADCGARAGAHWAAGRTATRASARA